MVGGSFSINDIVFVPDMCSVHSMVYYGEHRTEISCPCTWRHVRAQVTKLHGNFVHVRDIINSERITAFYHQDITLIQRAGVEDGAD